MSVVIRKYTATILFIMLIGRAEAQRYDNIWVLGYFGGGFESNASLPALDFRCGYPDSTLFYPPFDFVNTNASICDSNGYLVLFTNGTQIANRYQRIVAGSDSFNFDPVMAYYGDVDEPGDQCALILPFSDSDNLYYIFHNHYEFLDFTYENYAPVNLLYSVIDMSQDSGLGVMTQKGLVAASDTMVDGTMQAVRHANGHDWWITMHQYNANVFYAVLLSSQGVAQPVISQTGPLYPANQIGQSVFSPDGSKYISIFSDDSVRIANFDPSTGIFSFVETFVIPYDSTYGYIYGCSVSPNSRYLYVNNAGNLFQFDLQASNVDSSKMLVGVYDNYTDPFATEYYHEQMGPDSKIYISTANGCQHLHVIKNPDLQGTACNFVQHSVCLSGYSFHTLPLIPYYGLDSVAGAVCDSVLSPASVSAINNPLSVQLYPNPTSGNFIIQTQNFNAQTTIIYDAAGRPVNVMPFKHEADISSLVSGVYFVEIKGVEGVVRKKVVKM
jgi:hypothetical protein